MKKVTKIKIVLAVVIAVVAGILSWSITKSTVKEVDTYTANELALEQMKNEDDSSAQYEAYRNIRNDINTYVPICLGVGAVVIIVLMFIPEMKSKHDSEDCN